LGLWIKQNDLMHLNIITLKIGNVLVVIEVLLYVSQTAV
ncbi:uncharacterized protein METZ01_LOCUS353465, partial [marine metagenome]